MRPLWFRTCEKYTRDDCLRVIKEFYNLHGRLITQRDIKRLSKKRKSPCWAIFFRYGGLIHLSNTLGLTNKKERSCQSVYDAPIRPIIKRELNNFVAKEGRVPTSYDINSKYFSVTLSQIKKEFCSFENCLNFFGYAKARARKIR